MHLLLRVAERPKEVRPGWVALPAFGPAGRYEVEWVREQNVDRLDPRGVAFRRDGQHRLTTVSHLRLATSRDGRSIDWISPSPTLAPTTRYEAWGMEDARIVRIGEVYYITYVAVSGDGIVTALARTANFETFERLGVVFLLRTRTSSCFHGASAIGTPPCTGRQAGRPLVNWVSGSHALQIFSIGGDTSGS